MIGAEEFCAGLAGRGIDAVSGVPCSFFAGPLALLTERGGYVPAVNEGAALAYAAGAAATGTRAAVLIQNSGLGNLVNPLTSLSMTYGIPVLLFVSLRGWPDPDADEPQHAVMGRTTHGLLDVLGIRHWDLGRDLGGGLAAVLDAAVAELDAGRSAAVLVPRGSIGGPVPVAVGDRPGPAPGALTRATAVAAVLSAVPPEAAVVCTTGLISREACAVDDRPGSVYLQGSMGHVLAFALGLADRRPDLPVVVLDGDGSLLMHLGTVVTAGAGAPGNLVHVLVDNGTYETTGGQPTVAGSADLAAVALAAGYREAAVAATGDEVAAAVGAALAAPGPRFVRVPVGTGGSGPAPRVTAGLSPTGMRDRFAAWLHHDA